MKVADFNEISDKISKLEHKLIESGVDEWYLAGLKIAYVDKHFKSDYIIDKSEDNFIKDWYHHLKELDCRFGK